MNAAPYNTPVALSREPLTAAFWVLCAPVLFPVLGQGFGIFFWPGLADTMRDASASHAAISMVWSLFAVIHLAHFGLLSFWSEYVGAGAFAGSMKASQNWIIAAVLLGPPILIGPEILVGLFFGGEDGWAYSGSVNQSLFAPSNWGPAFLIFTLLLAPLLEEVTFRGVGMGAMLVRGVSPMVAAVLSSAAFTLFHLQYSLPALAVVFVASLGFSWLRVASGTMVVPILAHITANSAVLYIASLAPPAG